MRIQAILGALMAGSLLLASCLLPDEFDVMIEVFENGAYSVAFDGKLLDINYLKAKATNETMTEDDRKDADALDAELLKAPGFKEIKKIGDGTYRVKYEYRGNIADGNFYFLNANWSLFSLEKRDEGGMLFTHMGIDPENEEQFRLIQYKPSGKISIRANSKLTMEKAPVRQNAYEIKGNYAQITFDERNKDGVEIIIGG